VRFMQRAALRYFALVIYCTEIGCNQEAAMPTRALYILPMILVPILA